MKNSPISTCDSLKSFILNAKIGSINPYRKYPSDPENAANKYFGFDKS
jgi:hypothetical protein